MGSRGDVKGFSGIDIRVSARVVSFLTFSICARPLACVKLSTVFLNMACWAKREPSGIPLLYYYFFKKSSAKLSPYGWGLNWPCQWEDRLRGLTMQLCPSCNPCKEAHTLSLDAPGGTCCRTLVNNSIYTFGGWRDTLVLALLGDGTYQSETSGDI